MPPKKSVKADTTAASGDEAHTTNGEGKTGPTSEDWQFLMDCMKCSVGGQVAVSHAPSHILPHLAYLSTTHQESRQELTQPFTD